MRGFLFLGGKMYQPCKSEFKKLAQKYNLIPVYKEIISDIDTPVSAFLKLVEGENAFLLESVEGGEKLGRYSFLGSNPYLVVTVKDKGVRLSNEGLDEIRKINDPLRVVEEIISLYRPAILPDLPPFQGGAVGYLSYDAVRYFEDIPREANDDLGLPDMIFMFTDTILIFDHLKHKIYAVANARVDGNKDDSYDKAIGKIDLLIEKLRQPFSHSLFPDLRMKFNGNSETNINHQDFIAKVKEAKDYILAGDVLQVVLSQRFLTSIKSQPFDIYRILRTINPSPYMYFLKFKELNLIGSSPEPLVKVEGRKVITRPIAGTRPRGKNLEEDKKLEKELLSDQKERAEHVMLVDLGRNDLGKVCEYGTVKVDDLMFIEKYSHVLHIVSQVSGVIKKGKTSCDALRSAFPAGTVTGAPKIRAMEIIDELEPTLRGPYAGAVGYLSYSGNLDTCITIRTVVVTGNKAYIQAGAGIVADSVPEREYQETVNKAQALLSAIYMAEELV